MSKKMIGIEEKIALCEGYTKNWADFFNFFSDGFEGRKVTADAEAQFFRVMTKLARMEYRMNFFIREEFSMSKEVLSVLSKAVSLSHIQEMSEAQFSKFQLEWHVVFINMNKALGRLLESRPVPKKSKKKKKPAKAVKTEEKVSPPDSPAES